MRATYRLILLLLSAGNASSADLSWKSPDRRTVVVELYTSEGCSSCPPADRWFSGLKGQAGLFHDFIPLAFHVDYWDSIGWPDRFAAAAFSVRQSRYAAARGLSQVYTPGVVLQGREWRGWTRAAGVPQPEQAMTGALELVLDPTGQAQLRWQPITASTAAFTGNVSLLGMGLASSVMRGENAGRQLQHDFVVLGMVSGKLVRQRNQLQLTLPLPHATNTAPRYAIAAWVSFGADPAPSQAVGGWLPVGWHP